MEILEVKFKSLKMALKKLDEILKILKKYNLITKNCQISSNTTKFL